MRAICRRLEIARRELSCQSFPRSSGVFARSSIIYGHVLDLCFLFFWFYSNDDFLLRHDECSN